MAAKSPQRPSDGRSLWQFLESLTLEEIQPMKADTDDPPWFVSGVVHEIDEPTYWYFLELLPPRWTHGDWFAFGEGTGPFRLFWKMHGQYFARELTDDETVLFCKLSRTSLHQQPDRQSQAAGLTHSLCLSAAFLILPRRQGPFGLATLSAAFTA